MVCSNCGTQLEPGDTKCPGCGALLVANAEALAAAQQAQTQAPVQAPAPAPQTVPQQNLESTSSLEIPATQDYSQMAGEVIQELPQEEIEQIEMPALAEDDDMEVFDEINLPLISSDNTEPKGSIRASFEKGDEEDEELEQFDADTVAPDLELLEENNNLASMTDISNQTDVSDYEILELPEQDGPVAEEQTGIGSAISAQNSTINIVIPAVDQNVVSVELPLDGSAPLIEGEEVSVGEIVEPDKDVIKIGKKEIRLKKGAKNSILKTAGKCLACFAVGFLFIWIFFPQKYISYRAQTKIKLDTSVSSGNNNIVEEGGYNYAIPKSYIYDRYMGGLYIYEPEGAWRLYIRPMEGNYTLLKPAKISLRYSLEYRTLPKREVKEISDRTINNHSYFVIRLTDGVTPKIILATPSTVDEEDHIFFCEIISYEGIVNEELFKIADDIIYAITKNGDGKKNLNTLAEDVIDGNLGDLYSVMEAAAKGTYK